ncbi:facilitated trehalose transporter Tret1-like [Agrilus planipennis]|uniref:Facilitated trehalose transporter Tret1-like n=1 Tax=Agrilus planipennis TaxID=224129 RepID=A0A1W4XBD5_AGRPL|nr:facilitated trehalose transporter Tret1-like [Agrilus planipennis]
MILNIKLQTKLKQYGAAVCVGSVLIGMSFTWSSPVIAQLEHGNGSFNITTEEASWIGSCMAFGAAVSAVPLGYLADRFGRKKCTLVLTIPVVLFTALAYIGSNVYYIYIGRVFSGLGTGGMSAIAPRYMSEIADVKVRASLNSLFQALIYCGSLYNAVLGKYLDYRTFTIVSNGVGLVLVMGFLFFPESPTFLMMKNDTAGAEKALRFFRHNQDNVKQELDEILRNTETRKKTKTSFWVVCKSKAATRSLVATLGIIIFQVLSGVDVLLYYAVSIFEMTGSNFDPFTCSIILSSTQILSTLLAVNIIERFNRKTFLYISTVGVCMSLILLGIFFQLKQLGFDSSVLNIVPMVSTILFFVFYLIGLGPIPWLMPGELYPVEIKGPASGLTITVCWAMVFAVTKTFLLTVEAYPPQYTFYFYSFFMILCLVFTRYFMPETKGKTLQEIQDELSR